MKLFVCLLASASLILAAPADIAGSWILHLVQFGEETSPARVELVINGDKATGTLNELKLDGTWQNDVLKIRATRPNGDEFGVLEGRLSGAELRGTVKLGGENVTWVARR